MLRPSYKPLIPVVLEAGNCQVPDAFNPPPVTLDSPAIEVMTDLTRIPVATIHGSAHLKDIYLAMVYRGVKLLLVIEYGKGLCGVVSAHDLHGERPMQAMTRKGLRQEELTASDIMTPVGEVEAVALEEVLRAEVAHVVDTLKSSGRQHALVVVPDGTGGHIVRGIFSLSQVARQLGITLSTSEVARNFAEIEAVLKS